MPIHGKVNPSKISRYTVTNLELVVQRLNVILDPLNELGLVLPDGPSDVGTNKQSIVSREDPKHLISTLSSAQLVSETGCNTSLYSVNTLIISTENTINVLSEEQMHDCSSRGRIKKTCKHRQLMTITHAVELVAICDRQAVISCRHKYTYTTKHY